MDSSELQNRLKKLAYSIIPVCELFPKKTISKIIENQLLRSVFSAAANYRAACKAQSHKAFISKLCIAFEEADETLFWLEVISEQKMADEKLLQPVLREADELSRILAASRKTSQSKY